MMRAANLARSIRRHVAILPFQSGQTWLLSLFIGGLV